MTKAIAIILLISVIPAAAGLSCGDREGMVRMLAETYREEPLGIGLADNGALLELLASGKTWTILVHLPGSVSCFLVAGTDWQVLRSEAPTCRDNPDCM
jgi:hypothetical protein